MSDQPTQQWPTFTPNPRYQQRQTRQQMPPRQPPMHQWSGYNQQREHYAPYNQLVPAYYQEQHDQPKRKKRVFLWVFLGIQAIFILWIVVGLATVHTGPTQADIASVCYNGNWSPLFKSQADCVTHYGHALQEAGNAGKGLGVAVIVMFWFVVDVILGISYGVYRLATRR